MRILSQKRICMYILYLKDRAYNNKICVSSESLVPRFFSLIIKGRLMNGCQVLFFSLLPFCIGFRTCQVVYSLKLCRDVLYVIMSIHYFLHLTSHTGLVLTDYLFHFSSLFLESLFFLGIYHIKLLVINFIIFYPLFLISYD